MKTHLLPAFRLTLLCLVVFSGLYTLGIWAVAQLAPNQGKGEVLTQQGRSVGFVRVGQSFTDDRYFYSRPSAVGYHAAGSGGSNKGPSNPEYLAQVQARVDTFLVHNPGILRKDIPADLVTASGSGLDPHISPQAARIQVPRIARLRNLPEAQVAQLVAQATEKPLLGLLGMPQVHVLKLNLRLDQTHRK